MVIFYFCFRSQEDVHKVEITHEKPEKFMDKVFCLFWQTKLTCVVSDPGNFERSSVYWSPRFPGLGSDYGGLRYNTFCTCKLAEYFMKFIKTPCAGLFHPRDSGGRRNTVRADGEKTRGYKGENGPVRLFPHPCYLRA